MEPGCYAEGCDAPQSDPVHHWSRQSNNRNYHPFVTMEERMAAPKPESFLEAFKREHEKAGAIVLSRDKEGRNAAVSVKDQFETTMTTASASVMVIMEMKLKRAISYLEAGNFAKYQEELHDVSNYALFCIVFETPPPIPEGGFSGAFDRARSELSQKKRSCGQCGLTEPHTDEGSQGDSYDTVLPHRWDGTKITTWHFGEEEPKA